MRALTLVIIVRFFYLQK